MSTLWFIRHGQASFGADDYDRISPAGRKQAELVAEHLCRTAGGFDLLFSGTLARQQETARSLWMRANACGTPVGERIVCQALNEYDAEGTLRALLPRLLPTDPVLRHGAERMFEDRAAFQRVFATVMSHWVSCLAPQAESLESWHAFRQRVRACVEAIMAAHGRGKRIAIVTSGGPIAVMVQQALGLSDESAMRISWQVVNASVTRFKCTRQHLMLSTFNEHGHLEAKTLANEPLVTYR